MTITILLCVSDKVQYTFATLKERLDYVASFWGGLLHVNIQFSIKSISLKDIKWTDKYGRDYKTITREYVAYHVIPWASEYDCCVLWLDQQEWQSPNVYAYSLKDQIFGVHFIPIMVPENWSDTRWNIPAFTAVLRHELGHMWYQRTENFSPLNTTNKFLPGYDNTHYFDFIERDVSKVATYIKTDRFEGWKPKSGVRMFGYALPTKKKKKFSGTLVTEKVYKSSDNRMFFIYTHHRGWEIIKENTYNDLVSKGNQNGVMSVEEANYIYNEWGMPLPGFKPGMPRHELVNSIFREKILRLIGYGYTIPNKHLLNTPIDLPMEDQTQWGLMLE